MVVADSRFRHSAGSKIELEKMAKGVRAAGEKWSSPKAHAQLEVWALENGEAVCTKEQVEQWRKDYMKGFRRTATKKTR